MHRALFTNWKFALLWAIGISASIAAFFSDGGGHEQLQESAQQIREKRGNAYRDDAEVALPNARPAAAAPEFAEEDGSAELEFDEPSLDPGMDDEEQGGGEEVAIPAPAPPAPADQAEF